MLVEPTTLSLITTYRCTAACDHCCFGSNPKRTGRLPAGRTAELIEQAVRVPSLKVLVFTGGECFLLGRDLEDWVARGSAAGLSTRCVTNGYWASSPGRATKKLEKLANNGLKEINLSTGDLHARFVPIERVLNGAIAGVETGLRVVVSIDHFLGSAFDERILLEHPRLTAALEDGQMLVRKNLWIPTDGSARLEHAEEHSVFESFEPCEYCLKSPAVTPGLDLLACCGLLVGKIPELELGSLERRDLDGLLADSVDDLIQLWIHLEGPAAILEFVAEREPDWQVPSGLVHICQACERIYHDERVQSVILRHIGEVEERVSLDLRAKKELEEQRSRPPA